MRKRGRKKVNKIRLTDQYLINVHAAVRGRRYLYDEVVPGLVVQITESGRKSWQVYKTFQRKPVRFTLGVFPIMSVAEARQAAIEVLAGMSRGIHPQEKRRTATAQAVTYREIFQRYFEEHLKPHTRSWEAAGKSFDLYFRELADRRVVDLTPFTVQQWFNRIATERGKATANRQFNTLRACIRWAVTCRLIDLDRDPTANVQTFKIEGSTRYLTPEEFQRLAKVLRENPGEVADAIWLLYYTAARKGNVLAMAWEELDIRAGTWSIPARKSKSGKALVLPLTKGALQVLERRLFATKSTGWVFPSCDSASGHVENIDHAWQGLREMAGIPDVRIHDLRHTAGSVLGQLGVGAFTIKAALGHSSVRTTENYTHPHCESVRRALEQAQEFHRTWEDEDHEAVG